MNERIRELILEAGFPKFDKMYVVSDGEELEKFAELIVQECIDCINNTDKGGIFTAQSAGVVGAAHQRSIETIRQHFGIAE